MIPIYISKKIKPSVLPELFEAVIAFVATQQVAPKNVIVQGIEYTIKWEVLPLDQPNMFHLCLKCDIDGYKDVHQKTDINDEQQPRNASC